MVLKIYIYLISNRLIFFIYFSKFFYDKVLSSNQLMMRELAKLSKKTPSIDIKKKCRKKNNLKNNCKIYLKKK